MSLKNIRSFFNTKFYDEENVYVGKYRRDYNFVTPYLKFKPVKSASIENAVLASINIANETALPVYFTFNGVNINVPAFTNSDAQTIKQIIKIYQNCYHDR